MVDHRSTFCICGTFQGGVWSFSDLNCFMSVSERSGDCAVSYFNCFMSVSERSCNCAVSNQVWTPCQRIFSEKNLDYISGLYRTR